MIAKLIWLSRINLILFYFFQGHTASCALIFKKYNICGRMVNKMRPIFLQPCHIAAAFKKICTFEKVAGPFRRAADLCAR